jgi:hypothetical protein
MPSAITRSSSVDYVQAGEIRVRRFAKEYWSSGQRQSASLHEVSYRACFKAELPRFFIQLFSKAGDVVYDPFMGRGTTILEAALSQRRVIGNDVNPLSRVLTEARLHPPKDDEVLERLGRIRFRNGQKADLDLSMFYHKETESEIVCLRKYLMKKRATGSDDHIDRWIQMIATTRLSGHSSGFFSVYSLPPNQAVTPKVQIRINKLRKQKPPYRDIKQLIAKKSRSLLRDLIPAQIQSVTRISRSAKFFSEDARDTSAIRSNSVQLVVTSPPFLNIVDYANDNWLRCWFNNIDTEALSSKMLMSSNLEDWKEGMQAVLKELHRICKRDGIIAFEVGEMANGRIMLDEHIVPLGVAAGLDCVGVLVNEQAFTKTSNIWGIRNNQAGTNTNRIVIFQKRS